MSFRHSKQNKVVADLAESYSSLVTGIKTPQVTHVDLRARFKLKYRIFRFESIFYLKRIFKNKGVIRLERVVN